MTTDTDYVTLLESPLLRVDMSRLTLGDLLRYMAAPDDGRLMLSCGLLLKCTVDDADIHPPERALQALTAFNGELTATIRDMVTIDEMRHTMGGNDK